MFRIIIMLMILMSLVGTELNQAYRNVVGSGKEKEKKETRRSSTGHFFDRPH